MNLRFQICLFVLASFCLSARAETVSVIDFSTDDGGIPLVNGQHIESPEEFGNLFSISSPHPAGPVIVDSDPNGPNTTASSVVDLLVDLGNVLTMQNPGFPNQTNGIFDQIRDTVDGGTIIFDFVLPATLRSVDLIDIDSGDIGVQLMLTDTSGRNRSYSVPSGWTNDIRFAPVGFATLDFTTLADQAGENAPVATAMEDAGFDASQVDRLSINLQGSGAIDNLTFAVVPEPAGLVAVGFLICGVAAAFRRRR